MAYTDRTTGKSQRAAVIIAVALLQGAAIIALVNGLTIDVILRPPLPPLTGGQIPLEPPPKPKEPPKAPDKPMPRDTRTDQPIPRIPLPGPGIPLPPTPLPPTGGPTTGSDPLPPPPQPEPIRIAKPRGNTGGWVTPSDYPTRDIREGNQGVTGFRLAIGSDGRVQSCSITRSSGFASLDEAACRLLQRRARFDPARDSSGAAVSGTYASSVRWQIPG